MEFVISYFRFAIVYLLVGSIQQTDGSGSMVFQIANNK